MSAWYWLIWAILSVANAALLWCSLRNFNSSLRILGQCREHLAEARRIGRAR